MEQEQPEPQSDQKALIDEVLRKVGRNLVLFQAVEYRLKQLVAMCRVEGTVEDVAERQAQRAAQTQDQTMGTLIQRYCEEILVEPGNSDLDRKVPTTSRDPSAFWMSARLQISKAPEEREAEIGMLKGLLKERNALVHHLLPRFRPDLPGKLQELSVELDEQRARVLSVREHFVEVTEGLKRVVVANFTPEVLDEWPEILWRGSSSLIPVLVDVAEKTRRPDGWASLSEAGSRAREEAPDAFANYKEQYGHGSLKEFMAAAGVFELRDEPMPGGGSRTLFRVRREDGETGGTPIPPS